MCIRDRCYANTYSQGTEDEKEMAKAFEAILKNGDKNPIIKEALLCHLMAGNDEQILL